MTAFSRLVSPASGGPIGDRPGIQGHVPDLLPIFRAGLFNIDHWAKAIGIVADAE